MDNATLNRTLPTKKHTPFTIDHASNTHPKATPVPWKTRLRRWCFVRATHTKSTFPNLFQTRSWN